MKTALKIIFISSTICLALALIPIVITFIDILYVPKQAVEDGDVWTYKGCSVYDDGDKASDTYCSVQYYIFYSPSPGDDWSDYKAMRDYLTCENGVIKHHHYVGKENTGNGINGVYIYKDYDIIVEEIGTYN